METLSLFCIDRFCKMFPTYTLDLLVTLVLKFPDESVVDVAVTVTSAFGDEGAVGDGDVNWSDLKLDLLLFSSNDDCGEDVSAEVGEEGDDLWPLSASPRSSMEPNMLVIITVKSVK
jgi:hypothetical protein